MTSPALDAFVAELVFDDSGLIPAIAQQWDTREVLMLAWMNEQSLRETFATGRATYWSRSRQELWCKGDTSGHTQAVLDVSYDCDADAILLRVDQVGAACHTGLRSCFESQTLEINVAATTPEKGTQP
ncbi:MAG: phosphoribosyl-AMP cyclohydrolase [Candidatus Nanopelagicales bacterium]